MKREEEEEGGEEGGRVDRGEEGEGERDREEGDRKGEEGERREGGREEGGGEKRESGGRGVWRVGKKGGRKEEEGEEKDELSSSHPHMCNQHNLSSSHQPPSIISLPHLSPSLTSSSDKQLTYSGISRLKCSVKVVEQEPQKGSIKQSCLSLRVVFHPRRHGDTLGEVPSMLSSVDLYIIHCPVNSIDAGGSEPRGKVRLAWGWDKDSMGSGNETRVVHA